jgi:hypothetical protein
MALAKLRGRYRDPSHALASTHAYLPSLLTSSLRVCAYYNWWTHTALLYHPESEVHVRPSSLMFQQMHNGVYPSWQCCTALKIFCALIVSSSLLSPGISSIFFFYCLHNSVFSRMSWSWSHTVQSLLRLALSLNNVHLHFLHVFLWLSRPCTFSAE